MLRRSQTESSSAMSSYHPLSGSEHEATAASPFAGGRAESTAGLFAASSYFTSGAPSRATSAAFTRQESQAINRPGGKNPGKNPYCHQESRRDPCCADSLPPIPWFRL